MNRHRTGLPGSCSDRRILGSWRSSWIRGSQRSGHAIHHRNRDSSDRCPFHGFVGNRSSLLWPDALTRGRMKRQRNCQLAWQDVVEFSSGLLAGLIPPENESQLRDGRSKPLNRFLRTEFRELFTTVVTCSAKSIVVLMTRHTCSVCRSFQSAMTCHWSREETFTITQLSGC